MAAAAAAANASSSCPWPRRRNTTHNTQRALGFVHYKHLYCVGVTENYLSVMTLSLSVIISVMTLSSTIASRTQGYYGDIFGGESERRPPLREFGAYMWLCGIVCVAAGERERGRGRGRGREGEGEGEGERERERKRWREGEGEGEGEGDSNITNYLQTPYSMPLQPSIQMQRGHGNRNKS